MSKINIDVWEKMEVNDIKYIISKSLRDYREKNKLTMSDLADILNIRENTVFWLENMQTNPGFNLDLDMLVKIWNRLSTKDENFGETLLEKIHYRVNRNYYQRFEEE